ncbi:disease resistance protein RGA2-like [Phaseolus vulgaris]|uniref:disease resistance protein RGA2-like n=1 Tax=Phaseolus vulgaris TaxID=3885 RepID=UPI0035CBBC5A
MPPNIGKLRHLRTLSLFTVRSTPGYGLAELHGLRLGGKLHIRGLENVESEGVAKGANLISKKELNRLYLSWGGSANSEGSSSNVNVERVLEALEPPSTLKSFGMNGYQGSQFPSWMRNGSVLRDLVEVKLLDCENCEELPPLGKLPHLKRLDVRGMKNVKWKDGEWYDGVKEKTFPSLEKLSIWYCPELILPNNMTQLTNLRIFVIGGCSTLPYGLKFVSTLQTLHIDSYTSTSLPDWLGDLTSLKTLEIWNCGELRSVPLSIQHLPNLSSFTIKDCPHLDDWCNWKGKDLKYVRHLPTRIVKYFPYGMISEFSESNRRSSCSWNCFKPAIKLVSNNLFDRIIDEKITDLMCE